MKENGLILLNTRDKTLQKILDFKTARLEDDRQKKIRISKTHFRRSLIILAEKFFLISEENLQKMTLEELIILDEEIARKAYPRMVLQAVVGYISCISIVLPLEICAFNIMYYGTHHAGNIFVSWHYLYHRKILMAEYGDQYLAKLQ